MSSSQNEMVHEQRPVMSADLLKATMKGNRDVLIRCLGLLEEQIEVKMTIEAEAAHPTSQEIEVDQHAVQYVLQSATPFGDTLLHLLVTQMHNELALMVFKRDMSLMKARNKKSETPLHCAAKVGNVDFIRALSECAPNVVKDVVREMDNNGDTTLHVAAKYGHGGVARELMKLDPGAAYMVNMEKSFPLYIATVGGYTSMVVTMLEDDPLLACQQYSNGMYPVHVATQVGNIELVKHFMEKYPDDAQLLDHCGRNFFHIAAEVNKVDVFEGVRYTLREVWASLINAMDYEGNTPLHIATIKEHTSVMIAISKLLTREEEAVQNNQGLTPFELWENQIRKTATYKGLQRKIKSFLKHNDHRFTEDLFNKVMQPVQNKWERIQVIGLGSVLITTVTFAAAFTIPGGYNQNNGTPIIGGHYSKHDPNLNLRIYSFNAFILANTLSFILASTSIVTLVLTALDEPDAVHLYCATFTFTSAAYCMVLAFGLGSYAILAPVNMPIAYIVFFVTYFVSGSSYGYCILSLQRKSFFPIFPNICGIKITTAKFYSIVTFVVYMGITAFIYFLGLA